MLVTGTVSQKARTTPHLISIFQNPDFLNSTVTSIVGSPPYCCGNSSQDTSSGAYIIMLYVGNVWQGGLLDTLEQVLDLEANVLVRYNEGFIWKLPGHQGVNQCDVSEFQWSQSSWGHDGIDAIISRFSLSRWFWLRDQAECVCFKRRRHSTCRATYTWNCVCLWQIDCDEKRTQLPTKSSGPTMTACTTHEEPSSTTLEASTLITIAVISPSIWLEGAQTRM